MVPRLTLGDCELFFLSNGAFWLDGGALFGVVPRVIWEKLAAPDGRNRVRLASNPLLVHTPRHWILVDPGLGDRFTDKQRDMFRVEAEPSLLSGLAEVGVSPEEITHVVLTHLHFDHAGGCMFVGADGQLRPRFPRAQHLVQQGEWEDASSPDERTRTAYRLGDYVPLGERGQVLLLRGAAQVEPNLRVEMTGGHTRCHQIVFVESGGETAVYLGGILAVAAQLPIPYAMGFDLYPVEVMQRRRELYARAVRENWLLCLEHDSEVRAGRLSREGERYRLQRVV